jgi:transposase
VEDHRGRKAKQKRSDLRLVGLSLVVTRDGGVPPVSHTYPGNRPDVTQFATMIDLLSARHAALVTRVGPPTAAEVTVVFDAGQNSVANFTHLIGTGLAFVGSGPPSDCPDPARPAG